jgi:hypothetical protein
MIPARRRAVRADADVAPEPEREARDAVDGVLERDDRERSVRA